MRGPRQEYALPFLSQKGQILFIGGLDEYNFHER